MSSYGSSFIKHLQFRSNWAFVVSGTNNQRIVHAESFQNTPKSGGWASPVKIRTLVKLLPENVVKCNWEDTIANRRRREFCDIYEGYGDVCRCKLFCFLSCSFDLAMEGVEWGKDTACSGIIVGLRPIERFGFNR